ncbi:hypothetical protein TSUD_17590 [Trifolium subterraneum]|uniref:BRX domain-containing protein n=1 Tax=Trifolium subterraneum TaxID=3900 RepID=A0A2Z6M0N4_TRISU|nr:hypothetical protein TSUD_17590 [Trifolium subterraneum]
MQDMKINELQKNIEQANLLAGEEFSKHREVRDFIKSMADELREVTENLPPEIPGSETLKEIHAQAQYILQGNLEFESSFQSGFESEKQTGRASDSNSSKPQEQRSEGNDEASKAVPSIDGGNVPHKCRRSYVSSTAVSPPSSENRSRSPESLNPVSEEEISIIEQFEHGVYVTVSLLPGDVKVFKRVRFSKRRFSEQQAEEWWNNNKDRLQNRYTIPNEMTEENGEPSHS